MPMTMFGCVGGLPLGRAPLLPAPLERQSAEHRRLAGARRRAARRLVRIRRVPEVREDVHAARLDLGGLRVLVLVDHVLVEALGHELLGLGLHPRGHERGDVETRVAVEHELVVDDLVRDVRWHLAFRELVARDRPRFEAEVRSDCEVGGVSLGRPGVFERHGSLPSAASKSDPLTRIMNGTGPFKLDHWTPGEELVLVRNDDYWREPAKLERVVIQSVDEWGTRFAMFQAGDADVVTVNPEDRSQMDELVGSMSCL